MVVSARYDVIGDGYGLARRAEPSWQARIDAHLAGAARVVNVGAGTGSYEPADRFVVAVEPSSVMISQRPARPSASVVRAVADRLPLRDESVDAALAVLTLHHWPDWRAGLAEMRRVSTGPVVVLTFDPVVHNAFWLIREYLPEIAALASNAPPSPAEIADAIGGDIEVLTVPRGCVDAVLPVFWARPDRYFEPGVHRFSSSLASLPTSVRERGLAALRDDLTSGRWHDRHAELVGLDALDCGFRLVVPRR